jgi:Protein of unknown function (DUF2846)
MKRTFAGVALLALAACVSVPKATPEADLAAKRFQPVAGRAQLYIVRPSSFGLAIMYQVSIDGRIVGSLAAETFLVQQLDAGTHVVAFFNNTSQENTEVTVEPAKNYFLRVGMNPAATSNRARMKLVPEEEGQQLVRSNSMVQSMPVNK